VMEGVGHFINQEKAEEISNHIYDYISKYWSVLLPLKNVSRTIFYNPGSFVVWL
jgi:hypothetical protein